MEGELNNFEFSDLAENSENEKGFDESKDDDDKSVFSCKQCTFVTYNKRGISIHISSMHKQGKGGTAKPTI